MCYIALKPNIHYIYRYQYKQNAKIYECIDIRRHIYNIYKYKYK